MKLKKGFITHSLQDTQMMVAVGPAKKTFSGLVRSNETAALIIDCLKEESTEEDIVKKLLLTYEVTEDVARKDVRATLEKLRSIGAIEE